MVLFCFLFAFGGYKIQEAEKQKDVVAWVRNIGGQVGYDYQYDEDGKIIYYAEPPGPDWLHEWIVIDYFSDVVHVGLSSTEVKDIHQLNALTNLTRLNLSSTQVNDLSPIKDLLKLEELYLINTNVTDLSPIESFVGLESLDLSNSSISDLTPLKGLSKLKDLELSHTQVQDISSTALLRSSFLCQLSPRLQ